MGADWLRMKVELLGQSEEKLDAAPGRIISCDPTLPFASLSEAINDAFGRWGPINDYEFLLAAGARAIGATRPDGPMVEEGASLLVGEELSLGETFRYLYDPGVRWMHVCEVFPELTDPTYGGIANVDSDCFVEWGWGDIPDQEFHQKWDPAEFSRQVFSASDPGSDFT